MLYDDSIGISNSCCSVWDIINDYCTCSNFYIVTNFHVLDNAYLRTNVNVITYFSRRSFIAANG